MTNANDIGCMKNTAPLLVEPRSNYRSNRPQYPRSNKAERGLSEITDSLLQKGVISP